MKRFLAILLSVLLLASAIPAALGAGTYHIRIFSGEQGTIFGGEVVEYDLPYGDRVTFNLSSVQLLDNSKYYVKGIRESGRDNNTLGLVSFKVDRDLDFVVAYGLLGDKTSYTITYTDTAGNELAPSETYYGNVGDKPVVAYLYIDGYQPQYYNLTRTLTANASENLFNFVYFATATPVTPGTITPVAPAPGSETAPAESPSPSESPTPGTETPEISPSPGTETPEASPAPQDTTPAPSTSPEPTTPPQTEEILDLDVPQAEPEQPEQPSGSHSPLVPVLCGVGGAAALALIVLLLMKKRKKDKNNAQ